MQAATPISRREMLYYLAGGTALLAGGAVSAGTLWFLQQPPRIGEDWLPVPLNDIPTGITEPVRINDSRAWFVHVEGGLLALADICPRELEIGYRYFVRWSHAEQKFQCPGCGSQFSRDGSYVSGRSQYELPRFVLRVELNDSLPWAWMTTPANGSPVDVTNARSIFVDTTQTIFRQRKCIYPGLTNCAP